MFHLLQYFDDILSRTGKHNKPTMNTSKTPTDATSTAITPTAVTPTADVGSHISLNKCMTFKDLEDHFKHLAVGERSYVEILLVGKSDNTVGPNTCTCFCMANHCYDGS